MFEKKYYVVTYSHQQQQFFIETLDHLLAKNRVCYVESLPNHFYLLAICDSLEAAYQFKNDLQQGPKKITMSKIEDGSHKK